jgi:hypothetical protein
MRCELERILCAGGRNFSGVLLSLLAILLGGCSHPKQGSPSDGKVVGSFYTNGYFNLTIDIPPGWSVGEIKPLMPPNPGAQVYSFQLLMISDKPLNTGSETNISLLVMAEKASSVPGVKDARDYIARVNQLMVDAPIAYHPTIPITEMAIGNFRVQRLDFVARLGPTKTARQSYQSTLRAGYVISFILSAADESGIRRAEQVTQSARFH